VTVPYQDGPTACAELPPLADMGAHRYSRADCTVLVLSGEVDASCAPVLRRHLTEAVAAGRPPVVVDLTAVTFIDLVAVGQLVHAFARTGWASGSIRLVSPSPFVRRVLELTRVASVLPLHDTVADALVLPGA
jgi:anti-sigma B factor antagonist